LVAFLPEYCHVAGYTTITIEQETYVNISSIAFVVQQGYRICYYLSGAVDLCGGWSG
jgi:hypothetical protein